MKNTLTIICGVPGSGKSTVAKALVSAGYADIYYEADMWMMENGEYIFKPEKLRYAHVSCQKAVETALIDNKNVIVSNTSVSAKERNTYTKMAKEYDCNLQLMRLDGNFGSIHNVPLEKVEEMRQKLNESWGKII